MPLYDCGAEECEECQQAFRGVKPTTKSLTRQDIIEMVRKNYDPVPSDWPPHRGWDDGCETIADEIIRRVGT